MLYKAAAKLLFRISLLHVLQDHQRLFHYTHTTEGNRNPVS